MTRLMMLVINTGEQYMILCVLFHVRCFNLSNKQQEREQILVYKTGIVIEPAKTEMTILYLLSILSIFLLNARAEIIDCRKN